MCAFVWVSQCNECVRGVAQMTLMNWLTFQAHHEQTFAEVAVWSICFTPSSPITQSHRGNERLWRLQAIDTPQYLADSLFMSHEWVVALHEFIMANTHVCTHTPDMFSKHVIVTYCASFKRTDSPNLHCIGSGVNSTVTVRCRQRHRGKNSPTSYKPNTNCTDLSSARSLWRG